jgi:type II restriction enzyme
VEKLIDIQSGPVAPLLDLLLEDKSTKKNIIWATDTYEELGQGFTDKEPISRSLLLQHTDIIKPRIQKTQEAQQARTRKKAEVFTPAWLCNMMNNYCDEEWFGRKDVFNAENDDHTWTVAEEPIEFPKRKTWKHYVDSRRLEITCGEAPYLVSRYDVSTGHLIVPPKHRIGQLDRKLRIVNENATDYDEWVKWVIRAFEASYGYEYQGDNLLIARINLLLTFIGYYQERWDKEPDEKLLQTVANKIVWNVWQMDGLKDTIPLGKPYAEYHQMTLADFIPEMAGVADDEPEAIPCKIYDWRRDNSILFNKLKGDVIMVKKLFDFVIGNPPYQDTTDSDSTRMPPVYNDFMNATYDIADKVELIHPARFLFNAGYTPKKWNEKMLNDKHFKILEYEPDCTKIFANTDIKGGLVVSYRDSHSNFGAIGTFTKYPELNLILNKVKDTAKHYLNEIISSPLNFKVSDLMVTEHPNLVPRLRSSAFSTLSEVFSNDIPNDGKEYIKMIGLENGKRSAKYIRRDYVVDSDGILDKYTLLEAKANSSGNFGETLSPAIIAEPETGYLQTFIGIGHYDNEREAENTKKYISTKFARAMLGVLKITQDCPGPKWKYVPLQDFTSNSDIDWSKSVHEIDLQLYRKYGLDEKEINFIESHVKEMA